MSDRVIQGFFVGGGRMPPLTKAARALAQRIAAPVPRPIAQPPAPTFAPRAGGSVQRQAAPGRLPFVHTAAADGSTLRDRALKQFGGDGSFAVDPARVGLVRSGGKPLPGALLAKMEAALGADFSNVRVHIGPQASRIGALAFTTGNDLYFAPGQYQPDSIKGQQLIGHELAHVIQQRQGRVRASGSGVAVVQDRVLEAEADRLGMKAAAHRITAQRRIAPGPLTAPRHVMLVQRMMSGTDDPPAFTGNLTAQQLTWRRRLWGNFGEAGFTVDQFCDFVTSFATMNVRDTQLTLLRALRTAGALHPPIAERIRDGLTLSFNPANAHDAPDRTGPPPNARTLYGMGNPPHDHVNMLDFWEAHVNTPVPHDRDRREHLMSPTRRYRLGDNEGNPLMNGGNPVLGQGHSNLVMGHLPSASTYINNTGHMHSPGTNRQHNYSPSAYGQVEDAQQSAASGSQEPRYVAPSPTINSWEGYYQSDHPRFDARYRERWPTHIRRRCAHCGHDRDHEGAIICSSCGQAY